MEVIKINLDFECHSSCYAIRHWRGRLRIVKIGNPCEAEVSAQGSRFHVIIGSYAYGYFVCIPDCNIGVELSYLTDDFWNREKLLRCTSLNETEICTLLGAFHELANCLSEI